MPQLDPKPEHITAYERAVCYYTLPRVANPLSYGLIVVYTICVIEAIAAIAIGLWFEHEIWLKAGLYAFVFIILFGMAAFFVRAVMGKTQVQRILREARLVPDVVEDDSDLPDPFESHVLLRYPRHTTEALFALTEDNGNIHFLAERASNGEWWHVRTAQDEEFCRVKSAGGIRSFFLNLEEPGNLTVHHDERYIAAIQLRFAFQAPVSEILYQDSDKRLKVQRRGIYDGNRLVGRIYYLRDGLYLDINRDYLDEAVIGYYVALA